MNRYMYRKPARRYIPERYPYPQQAIKPDLSRSRIYNIERTNPEGNFLLGVVMLAALSGIGLYLHQSGLLKFPSLQKDTGQLTDTGETPKLLPAPKDAVPPFNGKGQVPPKFWQPRTELAGGTGEWTPDIPFPSMTTEAVHYNDVFNAFSYVQQVAFQMGYSQWPLQDREANPADTLSSIVPFKGQWIPSSAIPPQMYLNQYSNSIALLTSLNPQKAYQLGVPIA